MKDSNIFQNLIFSFAMLTLSILEQIYAINLINKISNGIISYYDWFLIIILCIIVVILFFTGISSFVIISKNSFTEIKNKKKFK